MKKLSHMGATFDLDEQGFLLDSASWNETFAEGMARECDIPVLSTEHWDVIRFVRDEYEKSGICPTIFATANAIGLLPLDLKRLFPAGYHRGVCRVAGVHYRINHIPYGEHIKESVADMQALASEKVYSIDVRGFLVDPNSWDENYAVHRAMELKIADGRLTDDHWQIIHYLREVFKQKQRIPTIYETCENCNLDLKMFEHLFPEGYHRGALKIAGLRFMK